MRPAVLVAALAAASPFLTGCGAQPAGTDVTHALDAVDQAVAARHWGDARSRLDDLVRLTVRDQADGRLSEDRAQQIEAAAARLAVRIPRPGAPRSAAGTSSSGSATTSGAGATGGQGDGGQDSGDEGD